MSAAICGAVYLRPGMLTLDDPLNPAGVECTFLDGHSGECSWADLKEADALAYVPAVATEALDVASAICAGAYDPYLELLLNAAHNRKRALRRTPGFADESGRAVFDSPLRDRRRR